MGLYNRLELSIISALFRLRGTFSSFHRKGCSAQTLSVRMAEARGQEHGALALCVIHWQSANSVILAV